MKLIIMCTEFEMIILRSTQWRLLASFVILITSYQVAAQDGQVKCKLFSSFTVHSQLNYLHLGITVEVVTLLFL